MEDAENKIEVVEQGSAGDSAATPRAGKVMKLQNEAERQSELEKQRGKRVRQEQEYIDRMSLSVEDSLRETREERQYNEQLEQRIRGDVYRMHGISEDKLEGMQEYKNALYQGIAFAMFFLSLVLFAICGVLHGFGSNISLFMALYTAIEGALLSNGRKQVALLNVLTKGLYILLFPVMLAIFTCYEIGYQEYDFLVNVCTVAGVVILMLGAVSYFLYDPYRADRKNCRKADRYITEIEKAAAKQVRQREKTLEKQEKKRLKQEQEEEQRQQKEEEKSRRKAEREAKKLPEAETEEKMRFVKDYMGDATLRGELNALTRETFYFDFESWVTGGYYTGEYIPYSYEEDGKLVANVSVNQMYFEQNGQKKHYIQISTVMTAKEHRRKGYAAQLMRKVLEEYKDQADAIYLFANLEATGFYEKLGFQRTMECQCTLTKEQTAQLLREGRVTDDSKTATFQPVDGQDSALKNKYLELLRTAAVNSALEQTNRFGLQTFYTAGMENVYYCVELDSFAVMELEETKLRLQSIISAKHVSVKEVLCRVPFAFEEVVLGFTPCGDEKDGFTVTPYDGGEDYVLYYMGDGMKDFEEQKLLFPVFSHA